MNSIQRYKLGIAHLFRCALTLISPKLNTKVVYRAKFGRKLDLRNPITLNEKSSWLKLNTYYDNPLVKKCADKYRVRQYLEELGCPEILNELIGAYRSVDEINWEKLPSSFVIKLNIGCGFNYIVFDKNEEIKEDVFNRVNTWLKRAPKYYLGYAEMQYKDVEPVIIIEKYLGGKNRELPEDYKFFLINGKCYMTMFCQGRDTTGHGAKFYYMDMEWKMIANTANSPTCPVAKPNNLDKAVEYAELLAKPFPYVRVDLYLFPEKIVFGELTFSPAGGMDVDQKLIVRGKTDDIDHVYGKLLQLPN